MRGFFSATANKKATLSVEMGGGIYHTVGLFSTAGTPGTAWGWGGNQWGQLGDNTIVSKSTPVSVLGAAKTFCKIDATFRTTLAIDKNGKAWGWGYNFYGEIGDNTTVSKSTPIAVLGATKTFCKIVGGGFFSSALDKNGKIWTWGRNNVGQLGDNTIVNKSTPVSVVGAAKTFCDISTYGYHMMALDNNGRVWCWGDGLYGALGDNTAVSKRTPVSVLGAVKTFCKIFASSSTSLAIDKNGRVWSWGFNGYGQLGDNTATNRSTPVSVLGTVKTFCKIALSDTAVAGIDKNGKLWTWGWGGAGELANNSNGPVNSVLTPIAISGATKTFCNVFGSYQTMHAIDSNNNLWGWGYNLYGQLGDNTVLSRLTPVRICKF